MLDSRSAGEKRVGAYRLGSQRSPPATQAQTILDRSPAEEGDSHPKRGADMGSHWDGSLSDRLDLAMPSLLTTFPCPEPMILPAIPTPGSPGNVQRHFCCHSWGRGAFYQHPAGRDQGCGCAPTVQGAARDRVCPKRPRC